MYQCTVCSFTRIIIWKIDTTKRFATERILQVYRTIRCGQQGGSYNGVHKEKRYDNTREWTRNTAAYAAVRSVPLACSTTDSHNNGDEGQSAVKTEEDTIGR